jgi:RHS repeat-associated protein
VDLDFASNSVSPSYDNNGNLTDDGLREFVYDAWNRLRKVNLVVASTETTIADYEYYGHNRRSRKTVTYRGQEVVANDGGDAEVRFYYDNRWRILETRNGSGQTTFQHLWGTQYTDELVWIEKNGDPSIGDDTTPDVEATGESTEDPADARYFAHQDRNWNVVALSSHDPADPNSATNGAIAERYGYTPYGEARVLKMPEQGREMAAATLGSRIGSGFAYQGLVLDRATEIYRNRRRWYSAHLTQFCIRDPAGYTDGVSLYLSRTANPVGRVDPSGLWQGWYRCYWSDFGGCYRGLGVWLWCRDCQRSCVLETCGIPECPPDDLKQWTQCKACWCPPPCAPPPHQDGDLVLLSG